MKKNENFKKGTIIKERFSRKSEKKSEKKYKKKSSAKSLEFLENFEKMLFFQKKNKKN
jgi:hypothetical protein